MDNAEEDSVNPKQKNSGWKISRKIGLGLAALFVGSCIAVGFITYYASGERKCQIKEVLEVSNPNEAGIPKTETNQTQNAVAFFQISLIRFPMRILLSLE